MIHTVYGLVSSVCVCVCMCEYKLMVMCINVYTCIKHVSHTMSCNVGTCTLSVHSQDIAVGVFSLYNVYSPSHYTGVNCWDSLDMTWLPIAAGNMQPETSSR